jgi:Tfp pilus assembly protein PilX
MFNNKQKHHLSDQTEPQKLIQFIIRAQQIAQQDPQQDRGYAMVIVSIVSVVMFSMMGAYLLVTNISRSSTNAYVDGTNTFYAAESGLNKRADQLRQKFVGYAVPTGLSPGQVTAASPVTPANIVNCFPIAVSTSSSVLGDDFECRNYAFKYNNNSANVTGSGGTIQATNISKQIDYTAFTFVADKTVYDPTLLPAQAPIPSVIPSGQLYAGLNSQQYRYTVYSTAAKVDPADPVGSSQRGDAKTVLQMDFKSQIIPLFQFAAFYDRDLEINSSTPMTLTGRVHTNANLYVQPTPLVSTSPGIDFQSKVTVAGDIYNRVDASPTPTAQLIGTSRVLHGTTSANFPAYVASVETPLDTSQINTLLGQVANQGNGVQPLSPPAPGFLRKRNYYTNAIGEYFGKADLRLEMTPNSPIPFNFTAIQSGTNARGGTCTTTVTSGQDPAQNYIDPNREGSNFKCTQLNLGQITSLQQPVLVLTRGNTEEEARFCAKPIDGSTDRLRDILNYADVTADLTTAGLSDAQKDKVLRALQVAISAYRQPLDYLNVSATGALPANLQATFATLLANPILATGLSVPQIDAISTASPASIAKARKSCFLPAPIVAIAQNHGYNGNTPPTQPTPLTPWGGTDSTPVTPDKALSFIFDSVLGIKAANAQVTGGSSRGLYDLREWRWLQVIQTNIESLTVWNRDGRFVALSAADLTVPATTTDLVAALNSSDATISPTNPPAADAFSSNSVLFIRALPSGTTVGSLDRLGLAAADRTERGLVLHAHVSDYLDGRVPDGTPDAVGEPTKKIYKLKADGNWATDGAGNPIILDYYRLYPSTKATGYTANSPYAFAVNGGRNLPSAMTVASDQAIYLQGDYNTIGRKPAAIMADTISVLSVNCVSAGQAQDPTNIPTANINCPMNPWTIPTPPAPALPFVSPWTGGTIVSSTNGTMYGAQTTSVNAAFLSFTNQSRGNLGVNRNYKGTWLNYSGGLNNYMRFVEDWSGQTFNYNGSMVSLGTPLEFSGWFRSGSKPDSYFSPPNRNFTYDTSFNAFPSLPPMTPSVIYLQQDVFRRN